MGRSCPDSKHQICSGSSGSGSRTGASGFSIGLGGSLIGDGIGSAGVRIWQRVGRQVSNRGETSMALRCRKCANGSQQRALAQKGKRIAKEPAPLKNKVDERERTIAPKAKVASRTRPSEQKH